MTYPVSHFWITAPYQEDRNITLHSQEDKRPLWHHIDCHQNFGGPFTGTRTLVQRIVSEAIPHHTDYLTSYTKAILMIAPDLRSLIHNTKETLTETAGTKERLRFYAKDLSEYLTHNLVSFILHYTSLADLPSNRIVFENADKADPLDQQFLAILIRRANPEKLSITVCTTGDTVSTVLQTALARYTQHINSTPLTKEECIQLATHYQLSEKWANTLLLHEVKWRGQWKAFADRKDLLLTTEPKGASLDEYIRSFVASCPTKVQHSLIRNYIQSACTSDDIVVRCAYDLAPVDIKRHLHDEQARTLEAQGRVSWLLGAIPFHYERGQSPTESGIQALLLATHTCLEKGFYEAVIDLGQRGRQIISPSHHFDHYWQLTKDVGLALAAFYRVNDAENLYKEIRALTHDPIIHIRISYSIAMHHTRFYPFNQRDHLVAKGWLQQALALIQLIPSEEQKALETAFHLNALALVEMHLDNTQEALHLIQDAMDQIQSWIPDTQHKLYRSVLLANRGQLYAYLGHWEKALADYTEVIRQDPYYDDTYIKRAKIYYEHGQNEEAFQDMTTGIENGFPSAELFTSRANILRLLNRDEEALVDYTNALDINPVLTDALLNRAEIYTQRGQYNAALRDYTIGITEGNPSFEMFYNRAHLFDIIGHAEEALNDYADALVIMPTATDVILNRALIFYEQEDYNDAQDEVERGLQLDPHHARLLCTRGLIESAIQDNERAYQTFTLALEHDASLLEAWINRAAIAYEVGEIDISIADLTQALTLEENTLILSNRAHAYQTQQRWDEALADYTRSLVLLTEDNLEERQELFYQRAVCNLHVGYTEQALADIKIHLSLKNSPYIEAIYHQFAPILQTIDNLIDFSK